METRKPSEYSRDEVSLHDCPRSCWLVINDKVFDVTSFLKDHPGGQDIILEYGGMDATSAFLSKGHSSDATALLKDYCIGNLKKECQEYVGSNEITQGVNKAIT